MTDSGIFIERAWLAVAPDGRVATATIRVSAPTQQTGGEWTSTVTLDQLANCVDTVHGVDSWQAVEEAMHHAAVRIAHLRKLGWRFYFDADDRASGLEADPADLHRGMSA